MAQRGTGYGDVTPNYGYRQDTEFGVYQPLGPPIPSSYGDNAGNTYDGHYDAFGSSYDQPAPTYQPTGSFGAVGEPVKPAGYVPGQFASPPQEPSWQSYDSYGSNNNQYGGNNNGYDRQVGYSDFSTQENYRQDCPPNYNSGFNNNRGGPASRGYRGGMQHGRGGFEGTDGYGRGGRGTMRGRGRGRGQYGQFEEGQFEHDIVGGGPFDSGTIRGRGIRGGRGVRGRGEFKGGDRGRGQVDGGGNRGRGQFGGENRGRGGSVPSERGRGQYRGGNRGRGQFGSGIRGRGQSDSNRGAGQVGGTRGRGWVPGGTQFIGQDTSRGRGQYGVRGNGQSGNRGGGQDDVQGGVQDGAIRGGLFGAGRGQTDGGTFVPFGPKTIKPFKMTSADAQGFISYKNNLQEYAQKNHIPIPQYTPQKADVGFTASVSVDGQMFTCLQSQREKKDAEQGAAFEALKALGFIDANDLYSAKMGNGKAKKRTSEDGDVSPSSAKVAKQEQPAPAAQPPAMSYKSKLNERIMKMRLELPTYSTIRTAGGFLSTLVLNGQVYQGVKPFGTKKLAEQHVAEIVYTQLDFKVEATPGDAIIIVGSSSDAALSTPGVEPPATTTASSQPPSALKAKPMKNVVQEYCQKNGMQIPIYITIKDSGMFISTVTVNGVEYVGTPHIMKKTAEQNAAKKAYEELGLKL